MKITKQSSRDKELEWEQSPRISAWSTGTQTKFQRWDTMNRVLCLLLPPINMLKPNLSVMIFGCWASGWWLGHMEEPSRTGLMSSLEEVRELTSSFHQARTQQEVSSVHIRKEASLEPDSDGTLLSESYPSSVIHTFPLLINHSIYGVYSVASQTD